MAIGEVQGQRGPRVRSVQVDPLEPEPIEGLSESIGVVGARRRGEPETRRLAGSRRVEGDHRPVSGKVSHQGLESKRTTGGGMEEDQRRTTARPPVMDLPAAHVPEMLERRHASRLLPVRHGCHPSRGCSQGAGGISPSVVWQSPRSSGPYIPPRHGSRGAAIPSGWTGPAGLSPAGGSGLQRSRSAGGGGSP